VATDTETLPFQAEVNQVLHLVIHSLYSHKEVFLRELISNASDALDKLRFRATTEPELLTDEPTLEIRILTDREAGTLIVEDTGVGMTREELAHNLGTIAHSGSRAFLEALAKGNKDVNLIGQFGVGFYSAYLVADRVEVTSRPAGGGPAHRWTSEAKGTFTVETTERAARGTRIVLHLKEEQKHFLEEYELRELIRRYSDYVSHPILLGDKRETANRASALWRRSKSEITDEEYGEFYKHLTRDSEGPIGRSHFRAEGTHEFVGLLFVPRRPPFDFEMAQGSVRRGVRLFVRRVFVMDNCEELLPEWLRFVRGVVDSDDLPLNVSREVLQDSAIVRAIRKQVTKKTLDLLEELARDRPDDYATFFRGFGPVFKAGVYLEREYQERLALLLRYESSTGKPTSLAEYVARMKPGQDAIYYAFGDSHQVLAESPHLEAVLRRGYEILYMTDPVDEFVTEALDKFEGKPLVSVMRADLSLGATDEEKKAREEQSAVLKPLLDKIRVVLQDRVQEVRLSDRLTDSPCCLVVPEGGHHAFMERLLRHHGAKVPSQRRILEINGAHPLTVSLQALVAKNAASPKLDDWIELLYDQALLTEGSALADPNRFARRMTSLLQEAAANAVA
jgi:molecular chaperone HtpG